MATQPEAGITAGTAPATSSVGAGPLGGTVTIGTVEASSLAAGTLALQVNALEIQIRRLRRSHGRLRELRDAKSMTTVFDACARHLLEMRRVTVTAS